MLEETGDLIKLQKKEPIKKKKKKKREITESVKFLPC